MHPLCNSRPSVSASRRIGSAGTASFQPVAVSPLPWPSDSTPPTSAPARAFAPWMLVFLSLCVLLFTGCASVVAVFVKPSSVSWQSVPVGSDGASQTVQLTNGGSSSISIRSIALSGPNTGDFLIASNSCGATLPAGSTCTATMVFAPTAAGTRQASLIFTDNSGQSPASVSLSGTGTVASSTATVDPSSLSFSATNLGSTSPAQTVTLRNGGAAAISSISTSITGTNASDFVLSGSSCGASLAPSSSCTVNIAFAPSAAGPRSATLTFNDSAGNSPQTIALSGIGVAANASVAPGSLTFAATTPGSTSPAQSVTLTNNGIAAVAIGSTAISGANAADFTISANTCGTSLAGSASCTVSITFTPAATGPRGAVLTFTDSAGNSPQTVSLAGTGTAENLSVAPPSLTFAGANVGAVSPAQPVTLSNGGTAAVNISSISITGANAADFAISAKTCGTSLAGSANCTVSITFTPSAVGPRTATLTFTDSAGNSPQSVALTGTGLATSASVSPGTLTFASTAVGSTTAAQAVTLSNGGTAAINISSILIAGANPADFAISAKTCGTSLAGSASCTVSITFTPSAVGPRAASLTFTDSAGNSPQSVALSGTGAGTSASASVTPASLTFASTSVGSTTAAQSVTLSNGGTAVINISSILISGANASDFAISSKTCGTSLPGSGDCLVSLTFSPSATGSRTATLTFTDSAVNSPQVVAISGTGTPEGASVAPTTLTFTATEVGSTTAAQSVTLTNGGVAAINISSIATSGTNPADFAISANTCGASLASGSGCTVSITFTPSATGTRSARLTFTDSAVNSPQAVSLSGSSGFSISPMNPKVAVNGKLQFSATTAVMWSASCGSIGNASGQYIAPSTAGGCTITATETMPPNLTHSTSVTVVSTQSGTLAIYPASAAVVAGTQQVFEAQISGVPDTDLLSYSVDGVSGGNSTVGTITSQGLYTAPSADGTHTITVTDNTNGKTAVSYATVFSFVWVDFGSRGANANPVPAGMFGAQYLESMHDAADLALMQAGGITQGRTYAQIPAVFQTSTPNWAPIDATIKRITANGGVKVMLEMYQMPTWLQASTYCGVYSIPSDLNAWGSIGAQYVKHMDTTFPGVVTDYEIWNEPDNSALCVPAGDNQMTDYMNMYKAMATQMKAQAQADGTTIRVGGPVTAGLQSAWVTAMLNDPTISQNIDFISYHNYFVGTPGLSATWDTYNGTPSIYQVTQDINGPANVYDYAGSLTAAGKQPQGKNLPIYVSEYNLDWLFAKNCCSDDFTYGPLWNALYLTDLLDAPFGYPGAPNSMSRLIYYASAGQPYLCLVGEIDANMDCAYPAGSTPQPYPQYFAYQLIESPNYLGLQSGGYMAAAMNPPRMYNGLVVSAFFNSSLDAIVLINPSKYTYNNMTVYISNPGYTAPQGTLYQIVGGQSIQTSTVSVQSVGGTNYTTTVNIGPYSVQAIALH